jgi:signal transduction histidine kinase
MADMAGISIGREAEPNIPRIKGDRELLIRVMINLIGNAVKFSPQGGDVRVTALATGFGVKVSVIDKGSGIPEEKLSSIFERYVQLGKETEKMKMGTGLGLTICRQIVEAHGGKIRAENAAGGGSMFTVELPYPAPATSETSRL